MFNNRLTGSFLIQSSSSARRTEPNDQIGHISVRQKFDMGLKIYCLNVNSVLKHLEELRIMAVDKQPHIICLNETKLDGDIEDDELSIEGFQNIIRKDRTRHGSGVAIYVKKGLDFKIRTDLALDIESISIQLEIKYVKPIILSTLYRPPDSLVELFKPIESLLMSIDQENKELYVNDMPQAVNSDLLLYADDTCLMYTGKDINTIEEQLNTDFSSLCDWFVDNKLSVHFGEEKTKSILFGTKRQLKNQRDLDLRYGDIEIKQHSKVTYLGRILDNDLSGESMATKVLRLVNNRLKFLYRKQKFLTLSLRRLLCNALIQPHYDYACSAWYPSLNKRLSKKIQTSQNKCIRYCLNLDNRAHVGIDEFIKINWLPTKERVAQCICVNIFKFFNKMSPQYMSEIFHPSHSRYNTRMATLKLNLPFRQSCLGQKTISYLGPNTWNNLAAETKLGRSVNTFKHDIKKLFFDKLKKQNDDIFFYY